jgi:hypothetical protein
VEKIRIPVSDKAVRAASNSAMPSASSLLRPRPSSEGAAQRAPLGEAVLGAHRQHPFGELPDLAGISTEHLEDRQMTKGGGTGEGGYRRLCRRRQAIVPRGRPGPLGIAQKPQRQSDLEPRHDHRFRSVFWRGLRKRAVEIRG